jgi:hypothetical protein
METEVFGPAGTNPRPCAGSHTRDFGVAVALLAVAGVVAAAIVRSRPDRHRGRTTASSA